MPLPAGLATVRVVATYLDPSGAPRRGSVTFEPSVARLERNGVEIVLGAVEARLDAAGHVDVTLPATDAFTVPASFAWRVIERISGVASSSYGIALPASLGASVNLSALDPVVIAPATSPTRGASAYEVAVANGFVGTQAQWLASLTGSGVDLSAYATDAELAAASLADRARANHTGSQTSATIADFTEAVQDAVAALLGAGSNVTLSYDDAGNRLTVTSVGDGTGLDAEAVRDAIGVALVGAGLISVAVNDALDTITITTTATANSTDAALRDRSTHTGTQPESSVAGLVADLAALNAAVAAKQDAATAATDAELAAAVAGLVPSSLVDAAGDLLVGTADNTLGRLPKGSALQALRVKADGSGLEYATPAAGGGFVPGTVPAPSLLTGTRYVALPVNVGSGISNMTYADGTAHVYPLVVPVACTMTSVSISINVAGSAGAVVRFGLYDSTGARVADLGTVAATAAAIVTLTVSQPLTPGIYYVAAAVQGAATSAPGFRALNSAAGFVPILAEATLSGAIHASAAKTPGYTMTGVTGAMPANLSGLTALVPPGNLLTFAVGTA